MIRIAEPKDLGACQNLLQQIGLPRNIDKDYLYLNDTNNGFTILVERDNKVIAISTFTIRRNYKYKKNITSLYWENLFVDKSNRDGVAYLSIIGYIKKILRREEFDDIYFVVRRKVASDAHKALGFKTFGYFTLMIDSIKINQKAAQKIGYSCFEYSDFSTIFHTGGVSYHNDLKKYKGFEMTSSVEIQRWLRSKKGKVIIDNINKKIFFLRSIFKNKFFELNIFIPGFYTEKTVNLSEFNTSFITVNLRVKRHYEKLQKFSWYVPRLTYEALCLKEKKLLDDFEIWEHDAW